MIAPGPRAFGPLGHYRAFVRDRLAFFLACMRDHGDAARVRIGPYWFTFVFGPEGAKSLLVDEGSKLDKQTPGYKLARLALGQGLFTSEGALWLRQRRLAQPAFHRERIRDFCAVMTEEAGALAASWRERRGQMVDVLEEMMGLTLRIVGRTVLGADLRDAVERVGVAFPELLAAFDHRLFHPLTSPPLWMPTPRNRRLLGALRTLDEIVYDVIRARRQQLDGGGAGSSDLVSLFLAARDEETGEGMDDRQIRDEVLTMMLAGHETTAVALAWTFYELQRYPQVAQRLKDELAYLGGRAPGADDLPKLVYTRMIVSEALRLYPPVANFGRRAIADTTIGGYEVRRGEFAVCVPYAIHRNPRVWRDADRFEPERFRPGNEEQREQGALGKYAYVPFGAGARVCIGNQFALTEATLILGALAQVAAPCVEGAREVALAPGLTLRPRGKLEMRLHP